MSKKLVLTALSLTLLATGAAQAQSDKITIMVGGMEKIIYLPAKLAEALGYYQRPSDQGKSAICVSAVSVLYP